MNAVTAFLDDHMAAGRGDRPAVVTPSAIVTYRQLFALVNRTAGALRDLGVEPQQRVAMLLSDGPAWIATFFACLRIGAVAVPLNTRLSPAELTALVRDSQAGVLVGDAALADVLDRCRAELPGVRAILSEGADSGLPTLDDLVTAGAGEVAPVDVADGDMAVWLYTSGTVGRSKAAIHVHRDLLACRHYGLDVLGAGPDDRAFATSKLFFAYALGNAVLIPAFVGGQTFLLHDWPDVESVGEVLRRFRPTLFFSVPTFYARLLRADLPRDLFASVRCAVSAGERLPEDVYRTFGSRFGVEILDGLGATETIFMVLSNRPHQSRAGAAGVPVPETDVRLVDESGVEVQNGQPGVLLVRTPSASRAYWGRAEESRRTFVGGWFRTGDVCTRDDDGFYYHRGRADDLFKVAGMWVAPADVEAVLTAHPHVTEAAVAGVADERGLVKPCAWVVAADTADRAKLVDELRALAVEKLQPHQRPRRIEVVGELPRTTTGKLQRFRLREPVSAAPAVP